MTINEARELERLTAQIAANINAAREAWDELPSHSTLVAFTEAIERMCEPTQAAGEAWLTVPATQQLEDVIETAGRCEQALRELGEVELPSKQYLEELAEAGAAAEEAMPSP